MVPMRRRLPIGWILLGVVAIGLVVAFLVFLYTHPTTAAVLRDVLIIALTLQLSLLAATLIFLVYRLICLVDWLQQEIQPILERARETVDTVHGTSAFLSRRLVRPTIEAASITAGIAQGLRTLVRLLRGRAP